MSDNLEKIINVDDELEGKSAIIDVQTPTPSVEADKERFNSFMGKPGSADPLIERTGSKATLMDVVHEMNFGSSQKATGITPETLLAQTKEAVAKIDAIKETLEAPNIGIKSPTHVQLLQNKLSHIDESLRIALTKVGAEFPTETAVPKIAGNSRTNPIERFLSFLSDGQGQLERLGDELNAMSISNKELQPVAMLAVQVKVGQIQQELELFSALLNKALESIKSVMNIQV